MSTSILHIFKKMLLLPLINPSKNPLSIVVKLALIIIGVIIAGMGILSLLIMGNQKNVLNQQTDSYAAALTDQLSSAAIEPILAGDAQALEQLNINLAENKGIEGVAIYSDQSTLLASTGIIPNEDSVNFDSEQPMLWTLENGTPVSLKTYIKTISFKDLVVGYCLVTFDRSHMQTAHANTLKTISWITMIMVFLGIIVACLLSKRLSRPIEQLVAGSQEISRGNYNFRFHEDRKDELGELMSALNNMTEGLHQKEKVEKTFSRFVSHNVAGSLMEDPDKVQLGGSRVEATVLFADISGFTKLSESLEPSVIHNLLNEYFTLIDNIAVKHNGHIDKYIGDCAMILFGVPQADENHSINAVKCGIEIQTVVNQYNKDCKEQGDITVEFSIGINSGTMLAGNMGSEQRMEYTVVGNSVNLASRLSSVAKAGQVIVTRELHDLQALDTTFDTSRAGVVELHGTADPIEIWQIAKATPVIASTNITDDLSQEIIH